MKKRRILLVTLAFMVMVAMMITACGKKETMTLEKFAQDNAEVQENIDKAMSDSNVAVEIKGNSINYTYDLSKMDGYTEELVKNDAIKEALDKALDGAAPTFGNIAKSVEESTEIQGIEVVVNYTWGDEVIVTKSFTSADASDDAADSADEG